MTGDALTRDTLLGGRLTLWQPNRGQGYRFNLDPILLAHFVQPAKRVVDLGAGIGIVGLLLLARNKAQHVTAVELQPELATAAQRNATDNGYARRLTVITGDCRTVPLPPADLVVFNPPYFPVRDRQRRSPHAGREAARHELNGNLEDFVTAARGCLEGDGRLAAIVPAARGRELEALFVAAGATALRTRLVRPREGDTPKLRLVEGRLGVETQRIEEPALVLHRGAGRDFTPEVEEMLSPETKG